MQKKKITVILAVGLLLSACSSSPKEIEQTPVSTAIAETADTETAVQMQITSEDLQDGVWADRITSLSKGENISPELAWTSVPEAEEYAIYMIDISADNWLHWQAYGIHDNALEAGESLSSSSYKGPYPPSGTHTYEIHIYALKGPADAWPGTFDAGNGSLEQMETMLDTADGKVGNIISSAYISGTVQAE